VASPVIASPRDPVPTPPRWAVLQRQLFDAIDAAAPRVLARYTHPDGRLLWPPRPDFQSIDALDDCYESFHNWPLFYLLGGGDRFLTDARREFDVINAQMRRHGTGYGYPMVVDDYQPGYDWFHQGEGNYLFYMLCMADPTDAGLVARARRFAGLFLGEDPAAPNWDPDLRLIRCARNGSKGPAFWAFGDVHHPYPGYNLPFYDVPGCINHEVVSADPELPARLGQAMRERMGRGDAVVNLLATTLGANAYLLTGDAKYRDWVVDYTEAWRERADANGGIVPDNVGLSGVVGEHTHGKWYGSMYGWAWPHGWHSVGQAVGVAAQNCALLTRRLDDMDFPRSQIDILIERGIEGDDQLYVPHKVDDPGRVDYVPGDWLVYPLRTADGRALQVDGWFEFMPMYPSDIAHLWCMSMRGDDADRFGRTRKRSGDPFAVNSWHHTKDQGGHDWGWLAYLHGEFPDYPERILQHNLDQVQQRLDFMAQDDQDPATYGDAYFQRRNPVTCEGLVQLTLGAPLPHYNGGLLVTRLRHFDAERRRPGLPDDVAALVTGLTDDGADLTLVNLSATHRRDVLLQAGGMAEHQFTEVAVDDGARRFPVEDKVLRVVLPPRTQARLALGMRRFVHEPSLTPPW
jgi:hypothetical protein